MSDWQQFFVLAGIPTGVAARYAQSFKSNRISKAMLPDIDKGTISELGVTAIGDQLAILRRIKDCGSSLEAASPPKVSRTRVTAPSSTSFTEEADYDVSRSSTHRKGRPPPDRDEIYHVKMPDGNTHRTKQIMRKAHLLRANGLVVRGTTGVRQSGRSVSPVDKTSIAARVSRSEVSSSTDSVIERLGVQGLRSDAIGGRVAGNRNTQLRLAGGSGRVIKRTISNINSTVTRTASQPLANRIRITSQGNRVLDQATSRGVSGGAIPRVTVNLGGTGRALGGRVTIPGVRVSVPGARMGVPQRQGQRVGRVNGAGAGARALNERVRIVHQAKQPINKRISRAGNRATVLTSNSVEDYDDGDMEEYDDGTQYVYEDEDDSMVEYEEVDDMDDYDQDGMDDGPELVEYVEAPRPGGSIFNRLSK